MRFGYDRRATMVIRVFASIRPLAPKLTDWCHHPCWIPRHERLATETFVPVKKLMISISEPRSTRG